MRLDLALAVPGIAAAALVTTVVTVRAATAPEPPAPRRATDDERRVLAAAVAKDELTWSTQAWGAFPEDHWSARDDFHSREMKRIRDLAKEHDVPVVDVLRAIDEDLHRRKAQAGAPDLRGATAVPCKPRPFYD